MPLAEVDLALSRCDIDESLQQFIDDAEERIDLFQTLQRRNPVPGFVPSDFPLIYRVLSTLRNSPWVAGNKFCEWGCGFGVVAGLAARLGFDAVGIEVEPRLVGEAVRLCTDYQLPVEISVGTFVPEDFLVDIEFKEVHWLSDEGSNGYTTLDLDPDDFHLIYAYPWPGEEDVINEIFDHVAARGAILLTYHGALEFRVFRKL